LIRSENADHIKARAKELGFLECRIIRTSPLSDQKDHFENWIRKGMHGEMGYMARNAEKRLDPALLVKNAKTMVIVLQNYFNIQSQVDPDAPVISKYAYGTDYHVVMKQKLKALLNHIKELIPDSNARVFIDSAPVLERAWGKKAGLGWIGKNSNLISVEHGSFFFIGEIILDTELPFDESGEVKDHCGKCMRCMEACPTKAIVEPGIVDARKCISYQTIELKGNLDPTLHGKFRNRVFGCDICQDVCPWNLKAESNREPSFQPKQKLLDLTKKEWFLLDQEKFSELFSETAVMRTGYEGLKRNLKFINTENTGDGASV